MSTFKWQVSDAADDVAAEQHQGGAVELEDTKSVSGSPAWTIEGPERTLPLKPVPGGTVELAEGRAPTGIAQDTGAEAWGFSKGAKDFALIFLVCVIGIVILVVAVRDSQAGNLTFFKLVEELSLLIVGFFGGLLKFRR
jgi:hypothetical protein